MVFVPVFRQNLQRSRMLLTKLNKYLWVIIIKLILSFFISQIPIVKVRFKFLNDERGEIYVPMSVTVQCYINILFWYLELILNDYTLIALSQKIYSEFTENRSCLSELFLKFLVQRLQVSQNAVCIYHICAVPNFVINWNDFSIEVEFILQFL